MSNLEKLSGRGSSELRRELHWSQEEKAIARRAFDFALEDELKETMREAKARAAKVTEPSELWELEEWLGTRRREIDSKYDYRYSVLLEVFSVLIREGKLTLPSLQGLGGDKLDFVRRYLALH